MYRADYQVQDLFGRGFSDGVADLPHDPRLYVSQMLLVLASSPLAWTGNGAFRLVGYSLGGGISVHFAGAFPHLVSSLVLLAPAGLVREERIGKGPRFIFSSGLFPERLLAIFTRRRLQQPLASAKQPPASATEPHVKALAMEAVDPTSNEPVTSLERQVLASVRWMVDNHQGLVPAFMSCIRYAPVTGQHESYARLADRVPGTTAILLAENDEVIEPDHYTEVALPLVGGEKNVRWKVFPGGHNFVTTHSDEIVKELQDLWGM